MGYKSKINCEILFLTTNRLTVKVELGLLYAMVKKKDRQWVALPGNGGEKSRLTLDLPLPSM
jgi:hypothetical protein